MVLLVTVGAGSTTAQSLWPALGQDDPKTREAREAFNAATVACDREMELNPARAVALCKAAVTASETLPPYPISDNAIAPDETAIRSYLRSLSLANQLPAAVDTVKQLIARRSAPGRPADRIVAGDYVSMGRLQERRGDYGAAEAAFATADAIYVVLVRDELSGSSYPRERQKEALQYHEAFRRARGDVAGADALASAANAIVLQPGPEAFRRVTRRVGEITLVESNEDFLTSDDVQQIERILGPDGVWWMKAQRSAGPNGVDPSAIVCLQPKVSTRELRRGRCVTLHKRAAEPRGPRDWQHVFEREFVQIAVGAGDASLQPPIILETQSPLSNDLLIGIVTFVRAQAVAAPTTRFRSDVQPWPVEDIWVTNGGDAVQVTMRRPIAQDTPGTKYFQRVDLRRQGDGWAVTDMR